MLPAGRGGDRLTCGQGSIPVEITGRTGFVLQTARVIVDRSTAIDYCTVTEEGSGLEREMRIGIRQSEEEGGHLLEPAQSVDFQ
jgi:hypothetical protein